MSQENVEIVRRVLDAWGRGDFDTALSFYDEDCVFYPAEPDAGDAYRGPAGVARYFDKWIWGFHRLLDSDRPLLGRRGPGRSTVVSGGRKG